MSNESIQHQLHANLTRLKGLLDSDAITKEMHDEAASLERSFTPYLLKRNAKGRITSVHNIFSSMEKEKELHPKRKKKKQDEEE